MAPAWASFRRWTLRLVLAAVWIWVLIRLAPHVAAVAGIESGEGGTPAYAFVTLDGNAVSDDVLRGRVVLVNFWATWCLPCRVEMPLLQRMADRHAEAGLVVLGLSVDRGPVASVRAFLEERTITYPVAVVGHEAERTFGGIVGYPTSLLLDRQGRIRYRAMGPLAMASFEPAVRRLLAEP